MLYIYINLCTLHGIRELDVQNCAHQSQHTGDFTESKIRNSCGEKNQLSKEIVNSPMSPKKCLSFTL